MTGWFVWQIKSVWKQNKTKNHGSERATSFVTQLSETLCSRIRLTIEVWQKDDNVATVILY